MQPMKEENRSACLGSSAQMRILQSIPYFLKTIWLFTRSDHKTFVLPQAAFGIIGALSGYLQSDNSEPNLFQVTKAAPKVFLWTWLNTFVFTLSNQRHPESVAEDALNKPFRPLPAGRISQEQTRRLLLLAIPLVELCIFVNVGAFEETLVLFSLNWMYNDLGGSDEDFVTRNLIISAAYGFYGAGALRVACRTSFGPWTSEWLPWICMTSGVIFTTIQIQDLKDQIGDRQRNRKTAPLVLGESLTRWGIAVPVLAWSVLCPLYWQISVKNLGFVITVAAAMVVAFRVLALRTVECDKQTWKLWSYWLILIYCLPLFKHPDTFLSAFSSW